MTNKKWNTIFKSRPFLLAVLDLLIFAFLAIAVGGRFLDWTNIKAVISMMTFNLLLAAGMTFVLVLGGIDLSVGASLALESVVIAQMLKCGISVWIALGAGLLIAIAVGLFNGYLTYRFALAPFLVTLGSQMISRGIATVMTKGQYVSFPKASPAFLEFGRMEIMVGPYGISLILVISLVIIFVFSTMLKHYAPLNRAFLIGANPNAARLTGYNVRKMTLFAYVVCALFAYVAAIFMTANNRIGYASYGINYEMNAIAAAVVGGASMAGGKGSFAGTVLGVLMLALITNGFVMLGGNPNWQQATTGAVLLIAVSADALNNRKSRKG